MTRLLSASLFAAGLLLPSAANACGGFFCNNSLPVDQTAEEILFAVDHERGETTMHVKVMYEGPASEFSWIVPVQGIPELGLGTDALFSTLSQLGSRWNLVQDTVGECAWSGTYSSDADGWGAATGTGTGTGGGYPPGVTVIETGTVGPYETVILQAQSSAALVDWLNTNGYDLPPGFDAVIGSYVSPEAAFVGLKLQKDKDAGDLAPLTLTYPGTQPAIPIQLTSVAATPDMRLRVYVLGESRAVPESYLHVRLNHFAVDWWTGGSNFEDVVSQAADEAGGHAFATDYAGPPTQLQGQLYRDNWDNIWLAYVPDAFEFLERILNNALPPDPALRTVLDAHIPVIPGVDPVNVYNCPWCYETELREAPFDAAAAGADVEAYVLGPRRDAEEMFAQYSWVTRMTSSVSPVEMTVDPVFVFNPDMGEQPQTRTAWDTTTCVVETDWWEAPRWYRVADGRRVTLPSRSELAQLGLTEIEYLGSLTLPAASVIERTGASGQPEILQDNRPQLNDAAEVFENGEPDRSPRGCGCESTGGSAPVPLALLGLLALGLRRRG